MRRTESTVSPVLSVLPVLTALPAIAVVLGLALTGCSANAGSSPTTTKGPLDAYLSAVYARQDGADATELNARVEELTAECMAAEGFDYVASPPSAVDEAADAAVEWSPDDADWVAQYGYGVVESPDAQLRTDADADTDPNGSYYASLPASEQDAYTSTLYGDAEVADDTGCYGEAFDEVTGDEPARQDEFQPLMASIDAFWQSLPDAPEMAVLDAEWADCMATAGHDFRRQGDAQQSIADAATTILAADPVDDAAVTTLHENEVALAEDDLGCREQTGYTVEARKVQDALQQQFVDDHRSELEALLASAQGSR